MKNKIKNWLEKARTHLWYGFAVHFPGYGRIRRRVSGRKCCDVQCKI